MPTSLFSLINVRRNSFCGDAINHTLRVVQQTYAMPTGVERSVFIIYNFFS